MAVCSALRNCVLALCVLAWSACSVHDASRLDPLPITGGSSSDAGSGGIAGSMPAGRGGTGGGGTGGSGGRGGSGGTSGTAGTDATGGMGGDASVEDPDAGEETRCGDGLVTGMEICDTGIDADEPGACPTECPRLSECVMRALNGTGCRAECVVLQAQCSDDDDCCPGNCMLSNDNDCSSSCGDGIVQMEERETCEPEPIADGDAGAGPACPEGCDDEDACTTDVLSGSAMNCNVECAHVEITALVQGDGCCPEGANTITDSDCTPVCGNHVRERGEDCDAQSGCNEECDLDFSEDQRACLDTFAVTNDPCDLCACTDCAATKLACFDDSDDERGELCVDLQACVQESGCFDSECFCGDFPGCVLPNGPCIPEVQAAAETIDALEINTRKSDTNYAIGRSLALDVCLRDECASACD